MSVCLCLSVSDCVYCILCMRDKANIRGLLRAEGRLEGQKAVEKIVMKSKRRKRKRDREAVSLQHRVHIQG